MTRNPHRPFPASVLACRADRILRDLWPGLLPPPPLLDERPEIDRLARWCARWTKGALLKANGLSQPPP